MTINDVYAADILIEYGIVTPEELSLVTAINGSNIDTYSDILYVRTGYHDFRHFLEEWGY